MNKYVIVYFVGKNYKPGYVFEASSWPLHVTLVPRFSVDMEPGSLAKLITNKLKGQTPFEIEGSEEAMFGPSHTVLVIRIKESNLLAGLHEKLVGILAKESTIFISPDYISDGYKPHVTIRGDRKFNTGQAAIVDSLSIVDLQPNGDKSKRQVLYSLPFDMLIT